MHWVPEAAAGIAAGRLLTRLAGRWLTPEELEALTLGIPGNVVNEMNLAIGDLADLARHSPQLVEFFQHLDNDAHSWLKQAADLPGGPIFITAWEDFLTQYGARGPSEIDILKPRWYEDPMPVLRVIAEYLNREEGHHRTHQNALIQGRLSAMKKLRKTAGHGLFGKFNVTILNRL